MNHLSIQQAVALLIASMLAGAVNSVAGGGTLITFPTLVRVLGFRYGLVANATSTVALWPGQLSSLLGYRKEIGESRDAILKLAIPSLLGGGIGAMLLMHTRPGVFARIVPFLILLATLLFAIQEPVSRWLKSRKAEEGSAAEGDGPHPGSGRMLEVMLFQFCVAIYGGYFGAGIGILMLAALGFMGFTNIHRMNGLKNINGLLINMVAIVFFILGKATPGAGIGPGKDQLINWPIAVMMMAGSVIGGYSGAGIARKIGQKNVRKMIVCIGCIIAISLFHK